MITRIKLQKDQNSLFASSEKPVKSDYSILDLIATIEALSLEKITDLDGMGDKVGTTVYEWFQDPSNKK
ncbi:hypothetical protein JKY72_01815 [Candidatus Gracilibacteria bacterium]|nr:hypothetical protein [Candidatus Gracilibacteria bacterium]